jgi:cytochrome c-type biogenesis protein
MESLLGNVDQTIHSAPWLAVAAVFLGGVFTAASPCVLAMIPLTMSFVAGQEGRAPGPLRAFLFSLVFVAGLSIAFTALGMTAALLGTLYGDVSGAWTWVVAGVCLIMGLHLLGVLNFTIPMPLSVQPKIRGMAGALIMGLLFGVVSAPCAAPILVVLLTYLAGSGASVAYGAMLLLVYALGHSVLILVAGTSMGLARKLIDSRGFSQAAGLMRKGAGLVIIGVGIFFVMRAIG